MGHEVIFLQANSKIVGKIRNIIFDLGGVLFDIDYHKTADAFKDLGLKDFTQLYTQLKQHHLFDELETGRISAEEFRRQIRDLSHKNLSDSEIDSAWNAILIGIPDRNAVLLEKLQNEFDLFLLSNTNEIHERAFRGFEGKNYGFDKIEDHFNKVYLSHHIGMRKPDQEIFMHVLKENNLSPHETIFIDDSPQHVAGALKLGIRALLLSKGEWVGDLLSKYMKEEAVRNNH
ncbi:MAG: HAD family phosphatase [Bacteroidetes bacterium]|nr:MAG: HAD family phosphatase [Bacteroidota bacterium]REK00626.1 MAG: HAD family phosphatase [Bacteroidota bacterium]REK35252.1 MAG: HAD family phosphatase [Bacteroidota bacterium]REK48329.1 MAG: HAD family phosphatase [Bacteroidota bacterium]